MDPEKAKELPKPLKKFYKGEPLALGITQILIGIIGILFGVALNVADNYRYHFVYLHVMAPYWTGVLEKQPLADYCRQVERDYVLERLCKFIISGSLSVAAARNPKSPLVKGMLGMNVVSAVVAGISIIFLGVSLSSTQWFAHYACRDYYRDYSHNQPTIDPLCYENKIIPHNIMVGMLAVFLLLVILELCISISNAAFGCKTTCQDNDTKTVVVIYQNAPPGDAVRFPAESKDAGNP